MFLVWADTAPSFDALETMEKFDASSIASIGGTVVDTAAYNGITAAQTLVKPGDPVAGMAQGQHKFYTMIISEDGTEFAYSAVSQIPVLNNENSSSITKAGATFTVVDAAAAAPEPTSGLLLLLGVAGLALKRRRA